MKIAFHFATVVHAIRPLDSVMTQHFSQAYAPKPICWWNDVLGHGSSTFIWPRATPIIVGWFAGHCSVIFIIYIIYVTADRTIQPGGQHATRGPRVGDPCTKTTQSDDNVCDITVCFDETAAPVRIISERPSYNTVTLRIFG
jgi:hypothetical protein